MFKLRSRRIDQEDKLHSSSHEFFLFSFLHTHLHIYLFSFVSISQPKNSPIQAHTTNVISCISFFFQISSAWRPQTICFTVIFFVLSWIILCITDLLPFSLFFDLCCYPNLIRFSFFLFPPPVVYKTTPQTFLVAYNIP